MRKIFSLGLIAVSAVTLAACGNNKTTKPSSSSNSSSSNVTTSFKNINKKSVITTDKGSISIYKVYGGPSYDDNNKVQYPVALISFKVTNNTNKELSASQISNDTQLTPYALHDGKYDSLDQPIVLGSVYKSDDEKNSDNYNKLNSAGDEWTNSKILPHKTSILVNPNPIIIATNKPKDEYLKLEPVQVNRDSSFIDSNNNKLTLDQVSGENVKNPTDILN
ncbi:hypothetical protein LAKU_20c00220 [Apilactobacillus kunkeei EFB6]|uniref:DUF5067 domain-containing protein n=1 Tax=Apilactobacillus kunkeei EFB6 TaxID=1419324 RepID=A0A837ADG9_9LACO|nr:hypothetical protein [Apilactobacillus kunkeei]KDB00577.1 hypothetical protein LAKU_20c00220 [Apilactobacillus kunkeei EFB6]